MEIGAVWGLVFKTRQYLKGSLWFLPLVGGIVGAVLGAVEAPLSGSVGVPTYLEYSSSTASTLLSAVVGSTAALTGFVVTVSVLVVQMATNTFSARYMRLWYRDRILHVLLAMLVGTFTFSFTLLAGVEDGSVPNLGITATGVLMAADMFVFLFFLDRCIHRLRPVAVAALVAEAGRRAFESVIRAASGPDAPEIVSGPLEISGHPTMVVRSRRPGSIQAIHASGLVQFARQHRCTLVLNHVVGDFFPAGAAVIQVYGGETAGRRAEQRLHGMFVLGVERTIEQDPAFAVRIMVDVAIKALSPAVNDPTTAVQVINHLGDLLHVVGTTDFRPKEDGGCQDRAGAHSGARLGGVPRPRCHRDPRVRRIVGASRATAPRDAGGTARRRQAGVPVRRRGRAGPPRGGGRSGVRVVTRSRPRERARPTGTRRRTRSRRPGGPHRALGRLGRARR